MTQTLSINDTRNKLNKLSDEPNAKKSISKGKMHKSVLEESFGAWKHRSDIKDSGKWVRKLRAKLSVRNTSDLSKGLR